MCLCGHFSHGCPLASNSNTRFILNWLIVETSTCEHREINGYILIFGTTVPLIEKCYHHCSQLTHEFCRVTVKKKKIIKIHLQNYCFKLKSMIYFSCPNGIVFGLACPLQSSAALHESSLAFLLYPGMSFCHSCCSIISPSPTTLLFQQRGLWRALTGCDDGSFNRPRWARGAGRL